MKLKHNLIENKIEGYARREGMNNDKPGFANWSTLLPYDTADEVLAKS